MLDVYFSADFFKLEKVRKVGKITVIIGSYYMIVTKNISIEICSFFEINKSIKN